jgi:hypothetical protein
MQDILDREGAGANLDNQSIKDGLRDHKEELGEYMKWSASTKYKQDFHFFLLEMAEKKSRLAQAHQKASEMAKTKSQAHQEASEDAPVQLRKSNSRYLNPSHRTKTCTPSEALKSRLRIVIQELLKRDEAINQRSIASMIDELQTPRGDDYKEATSSTEYYGWNSSVKHEEAFGGFLRQMAQSIHQPLGGARESGAAHGNPDSDSDEVPNGTPDSDSDEVLILRKRPAAMQEGGKKNQESLEEGPRQFRRLLVPVNEDDDSEEEDEDAPAQNSRYSEDPDRPRTTSAALKSRLNTIMQEIIDGGDERSKHALVEMIDSQTPSAFFKQMVQSINSPLGGARESGAAHRNTNIDSGDETMQDTLAQGPRRLRRLFVAEDDDDERKSTRLPTVEEGDA